MLCVGTLNFVKAWMMRLFVLFVDQLILNVFVEHKPFLAAIILVIIIIIRLLTVFATISRQAIT